jgi:hypothetical protein
VRSSTRAVERKVPRRAGAFSEWSRDTNSGILEGSSGNMAVGDVLCAHFSFRSGEDGDSDDALGVGDGVRLVSFSGKAGEVPMRCGGRKSSKVVLRPCPWPGYAGKGVDGALLWLLEGEQDLERDGLCDFVPVARSSANSTGRSYACTVYRASACG